MEKLTNIQKILNSVSFMWLIFSSSLPEWQIYTHSSISSTLLSIFVCQLGGGKKSNNASLMKVWENMHSSGLGARE